MEIRTVNLHAEVIGSRVRYHTMSLTLPQPSQARITVALSALRIGELAGDVADAHGVQAGVIQYRFRNAENQEETHHFGHYFREWPAAAGHMRMTHVTFGLVLDIRGAGQLAYATAAGVANLVIFD